MDPDVVLLDIDLPDLDGYEVAKRVRASRRVLAATARGDDRKGAPEDRDRALRTGFDAHLPKPIDGRGASSSRRGEVIDELEVVVRRVSINEELSVALDWLCRRDHVCGGKRWASGLAASRPLPRWRRRDGRGVPGAAPTHRPTRGDQGAAARGHPECGDGRRFFIEARATSPYSTRASSRFTTAMCIATAGLTS